MNEDSMLKDKLRNIDSDIVAMLDEIQAKGTYAYQLGREDALKEMDNKDQLERQKYIDNLIAVAELFYRQVRNEFPSIEVKELRIGHDYSADIPVALLIFKEKGKHFKRKLSRLAAELEIKMSNTNYQDIMIWTIVDTENIDRESLEHDFPIFRLIEMDDSTHA